MSRKAECVAMIAAGVVGAVLTVLALGAALVFLIPAVVGISIAALLISPIHAATEPPAGEVGSEQNVAGAD